MYKRQRRPAGGPRLPRIAVSTERMPRLVVPASLVEVLRVVAQDASAPGAADGDGTGGEGGAKERDTATFSAQAGDAAASALAACAAAPDPASLVRSAPWRVFGDRNIATPQHRYRYRSLFGKLLLNSLLSIADVQPLE